MKHKRSDRAQWGSHRTHESPGRGMIVMSWCGGETWRGAGDCWVEGRPGAADIYLRAPGIRSLISVVSVHHTVTGCSSSQTKGIKKTDPYHLTRTKARSCRAHVTPARSGHCHWKISTQEHLQIGTSNNAYNQDKVFQLLTGGDFKESKSV